VVAQGLRAADAAARLRAATLDPLVAGPDPHALAHPGDRRVWVALAEVLLVPPGDVLACAPGLEPAGLGVDLSREQNGQPLLRHAPAQPPNRVHCDRDEHDASDESCISDSAPGRGTTVRLTWESTSTAAPVRPTRAERIAAGIGDLRRPLVAMCLPYLAMSGTFAVRYTLNGRLPSWLLAWFVGLCAITLIVATRVRTGLSGPVVAAALGYGVVGTVAALFLVPAGALHNYSSWPLGATASLLAMVVVVRPLWEAGTALLAQQVAITIAAFSGRFAPGPSVDHIADVIPAALSTITPVVLGLVLGQAVLRLGGVVTRANNDIRARAAAESARLARESVRRRRLDDLNEEILPFLRGVAGPTAPRGRPGVRERARILEHTARDELHLPGVLDIVTRNLLRRARAGGCAVTLQAGGGDVAAPSLLRDVLVAALSSGAVPRELVVSVNRTEDGSSVSLVALPGDQDRAEALQREFGDAMSILDSTPEATWAEVRLSAAVIA